MVKYNICTNFYANYIYKGLALYYSLEKTSENFLLWILCMDQETYTTLAQLKLKSAKLIKIEDIESPELLALKKIRNKAEYSWTLKSSLMSYLFDKYPDIKNLLYLDADIYFFNDILFVYDDIGKKSLAISPHKFPKELKARTKASGIYNAGVIFIRRDLVGLKALKGWKEQCLDWCYRRVENHKFGDQMYLDEWPTLYPKLHQFTNPSINLAPWNITNYTITGKDDAILVEGHRLIFFHFHELIIYSDLTFEPSYGYSIPPSAINLIYKNYENTITNLINKLDDVNPKLKISLEQKNEVKKIVQIVKRILLPIYWKTKTLFSSS